MEYKVFVSIDLATTTALFGGLRPSPARIAGAPGGVGVTASRVRAV